MYIRKSKKGNYINKKERREKDKREKLEKNWKKKQRN